MTRKPDDWMPLHIGKYLANTAHLTRDQHGAYLLILMAYWTNGGAIDADDAQLAATARATPSEWKRLRPVLVRFFTECDGKWHQKKADAELTKAVALTHAKSQAGKKGAERKWQSRATANGTGMAEPSNSHRQTDAPLPLPSQVKKEIAKAISPSKPPAGAFEVFWNVCPRKVGKGAARKAYVKALSKASPEVLLATMRRYASSRAGEPDQFTVHPATWLNAERWADEALAGSPQGNATADALAATADEERKNLIRMGVIRDVH